MKKLTYYILSKSWASIAGILFCHYPESKKYKSSKAYCVFETLHDTM